MEAHQERVDDSDADCHDWSGFPELHIDPKDDPYAQTPTMWSATSQHFMEVALVASGACDLVQLSARLQAAMVAIEEKLADARQAGAAAALSGWGISPAIEPGLTIYTLSPGSITEEFPQHEIYASIAVWLLIQGRRAALRLDRANAARSESQALVCMALAFGEGARTVLSGEERERRARVARANADAGHTEHRRRKEQLLADYRAASWPSKSVAAEALAAKHHFSTATVRKALQGL